MSRSDTPFVAALEETRLLPIPSGSPFVDEDGTPATPEPIHESLWVQEEPETAWGEEPLDETWGEEPLDEAWDEEPLLETGWDTEQLTAALDEEVLGLPPVGESFPIDLFEAPVDVEADHE